MARRKPKSEVATTGDRRHKPATLMMGFGYDTVLRWVEWTGANVRGFGTLSAKGGKHISTRGAIELLTGCKLS